MRATPDLGPARSSSHRRPGPGKGFKGPGRGPHTPGHGQAISLPAGLLTQPPTASHVWTGVGLTVAAAIVVVAVLLWQPDNALAFMAFILAALTLLVAPVITVGLMLDVRHQERSGGQLPPGPAPSAGQ